MNGAWPCLLARWRVSGPIWGRPRTRNQEADYFQEHLPRFFQGRNYCWGNECYKSLGGTKEPILPRSKKISLQARCLGTSFAILFTFLILCFVLSLFYALFCFPSLRRSLTFANTSMLKMHSQKRRLSDSAQIQGAKALPGKLSVPSPGFHTPSSSLQQPAPWQPGKARAFLPWTLPRASSAHLPLKSWKVHQKGLRLTGTRWRHIPRCSVCIPAVLI